MLMTKSFDLIPFSLYYRHTQYLVLFHLLFKYITAYNELPEQEQPSYKLSVLRCLEMLEEAASDALS